MTQPTEYHRAYNFTNFQALNPSRPLPAQHVDAEYNRLKQTTDEIIANLRRIQRDDDELANETVGYDQLKPELFMGMEPPTVWASGEEYGLTDTVIYDAGLYRCIEQHTSGVFATDLAAGRWALLTDFTSQLEDALDALLTGQVGLVDTRAVVTTLTVPSEVNVIRTAGYASVGDGGAALYRRVSAQPGHPGKVQSDDGSWWELAEPVLRPEMFGALGNGATDDTPAFRDCLDCARATGSKEIRLRSVTYGIGVDSVTSYNVTSISNGDFGILIEGPIALVGQGRGTVLKRISTGAQYVVVVVRVGDGATLRNLTVDGGAPAGGSGATYDNGSGVIVEAMSGTWNRGTLLEDLWIENCAAYGIGAEWGNYYDLTFRNICIKDTGSDGIDIKMRTDLAPAILTRGVVLDNLTIENFGKTATDSAAQAALDIRGYVTASNIHVRNFGAKANCGIRVHGGLSTDGTGGHRATVSGFIVEEGTYPGSVSTYGVYAAGNGCHIANGSVLGTDVGVTTWTAGTAQTTVNGVVVSNVCAAQCGVAGFVDRDVGRYTTFVGCFADACAIGFSVGGRFVNLVGIASNDAGSDHLQIVSTAREVNLVGYSFQGSGNASVNDSASRVRWHPSSLLYGIADNDVAAIPIPGATQCALVMISMTSTTNPAPRGTIWVRGQAGNEAIADAGLINTTNITLSTGVLTGTTGADGNITISVASGVLYIENRKGQLNNFTVSFHNVM